MSDPVARVTLVSPDGEQFTGPTSAAAQLRAKGFRDLTEAEHHENELQSKYGEGALPAAGAFASGAASALTFGGSDAVLAQTPLAEANREAVARNPGAHTAGQVAALAAPIVGELAGASAAGKAAQVAGSAIAGVGKTAAGVGKTAAAITEGVGGKAIAPIVGGAAQAAAEGAAFQVGSNVGEASRRDVQLDAETLLAHTGEAAILGAGIGGAIPAAGKAVKWTAQKAIGGLEQGLQGLRAAGFKGANLGVDALEAGAGAAVRNADAIGAGVEGAANKVTDLADEKLLPHLRDTLSNQTGRPDVINEVFANGAEGRALRSELGTKTITGERAAQTEELSKSLNDIWHTSQSNEPLFNDLALAVKRDVQGNALSTPLNAATHRAVADEVVANANKLLKSLEANSPKGAEIFAEDVNKFAHAAKSGSAEDLYRGIDDLKATAGRLAKLDGKRAAFDSGAGIAADSANDFRKFAQRHLENTDVWGAAGKTQQEVNSLYSRYLRDKAQFEKHFATAKVEGKRLDVLDGKKITSWAREMNSPAGDVRNRVIDNLVESQRDLIAATERLSRQSQEEARATLGSATASDVAKARATNIEAAPEGVAGALNRSRSDIEGVASTKATAAKTLDRADVLQQTQNAILSRQGAGVNPLPVDAIRKLGGGALVGGVIGGLPGAAIGGGISSVLEKYGAITSNPKSAIEFLNTIDRLRGVDKAKVSSWIKDTLGEAPAVATKARAGLSSANESVAKHLLAARNAGLEGIERIASRSADTTPGALRRVLPTVAYADVKDSTPQEWWTRTQKTLIAAQANPQAMLNKLHADVAGIADTLPHQAQALTQQQLRIVGYLADKMPKNPRPMMLGDAPWTPDPTALKAFRDITLVATNPNALLPLITVGTATRDQVDAVRNLWPSIYASTKDQVLTAVQDAAAEGKPVSYESRLRLGQLLQTPLDASQEPGFVQWLGQAIGAPSSQPPPDQQQQAQSQPINLKFEAQNDTPMSLRSQSTN